MIRTWLSIVRRDLLLASRRRSDIANTLVFFVVVVSLVPIGVGPQAALLRQVTPGTVWIAALLAAMLSPTARSSRCCCRRNRS